MAYYNGSADDYDTSGTATTTATITFEKYDKSLWPASLVWADDTYKPEISKYTDLKTKVKNIYVAYDIPIETIVDSCMKMTLGDRLSWLMRLKFDALVVFVKNGLIPNVEERTLVAKRNDLYLAIPYLVGFGKASMAENASKVSEIFYDDLIVDKTVKVKFNEDFDRNDLSVIIKMIKACLLGGEYDTGD